jgi:hypothetical protein
MFNIVSCQWDKRRINLTVPASRWNLDKSTASQEFCIRNSGFTLSVFKGTNGGSTQILQYVPYLMKICLQGWCYDGYEKGDVGQHFYIRISCSLSIVKCIIFFMDSLAFRNICNRIMSIDGLTYMFTIKINQTSYWMAIVYLKLYSNSW